MTNWRMTLAYDGTSYAGWQVQPGADTIQERLEQALLTLTHETTRVHSSGRTDRGVHARAQVAHVQIGMSWTAPRLQRALNALLPDDIRVLRLQAAPDDFHARFSAVSKEYRYFIWNGDVLPPFLIRYRLHERKKLDIATMREAAALLEGEHDFAAFTADANRPVETTVRKLLRLQVRKNGHEVVICAVSEGFLYKMVRSLAGGLIRVGRGELSPADIRSILESRLRTARIPTALPQGLFLWTVNYKKAGSAALIP